jgi:hypothetical protein
MSGGNPFDTFVVHNVNSKPNPTGTFVVHND